MNDVDTPSASPWKRRFLILLWVIVAIPVVLVAWLGAPLTRATVLVAVVAWASVAALQARHRRYELVALWRTRRPALVRAQVLGLVADSFVDLDGGFVGYGG